MTKTCREALAELVRLKDLQICAGTASEVEAAWADARAALAQGELVPVAVVEPIGDGFGEAMLLKTLPVGTELYASPPEPQGDVVVTKNEAGQIVAVTRQDEEGRILSVIAESSVAQPVAQGLTDALRRTATGWQQRAKIAERNWKTCRRWAIAGGAPIEKLGDDPATPWHEIRDLSAAPPAPAVQPTDRAAYLLRHPVELAAFVREAEKLADDYLTLNSRCAALAQQVEEAAPQPAGGAIGALTGADIDAIVSDCYPELGTAPATPAAVVPTRTPQDYAIEHAEYMAKAAEHLLEMLNDEDAKRLRREESDDVPNDEMQDTETKRSEAMRGVRHDIYEFRKRRDRAAMKAQP